MYRYHSTCNMKVLFCYIHISELTQFSLGRIANTGIDNLTPRQFKFNGDREGKYGDDKEALEEKILAHLLIEAILHRLSEVTSVE